MEITGEILDDILFDLYPALLNRPLQDSGRRGRTSELLGVTLVLKKPRARLSRSENRGKLFSALGEFLWYLSGSDSLDFIEKYIPLYANETTDGIIYGAYGPRLLRMRGNINQMENVSALLKSHPGTRRAVIQLFNAEDIASEYIEIPCTTTLQFLLRDNALHLSATLRSNDAYWGLPHDIFCFTMLQEMLARQLDANLGYYYHYVGSMHIYANHHHAAREYLKEGHQRIAEMPTMPNHNPFSFFPCLLVAERMLRHGQHIDATDITSIPYWADLIRLLQVHWHSDNIDFLDRLGRDFNNPVYQPYLDSRRGTKPPSFCTEV